MTQSAYILESVITKLCASQTGLSHIHDLSVYVR